MCLQTRVISPLFFTFVDLKSRSILRGNTSVHRVCIGAHTAGPHLHMNVDTRQHTNKQTHTHALALIRTNALCTNQK